MTSSIPKDALNSTALKEQAGELYFKVYCLSKEFRRIEVYVYTLAFLKHCYHNSPHTCKVPLKSYELMVSWQLFRIQQTLNHLSAEKSQLEQRVNQLIGSDEGVF